MNKFIRTLCTAILFFSTSLFAQEPTFDLQFVEVQNDGVLNGDYCVKINISGSEAFKLGSSDITFDFNGAGLSTPTMLGTPPVFGPPFYALAVGEPVPNVASISIVFALFDEAFATDVQTSPTEVVTVCFKIIDPAQTSQLAFRSANPSFTAVHKAKGSGLPPGGNNS